MRTLSVLPCTALASSSDHQPRPTEATFNMASVLEPQEHALTQAVGDDGEDQEDPDDHLLQIGLDMGEIHAVLDQADEDRAEHHVAQSAGSAAHAHPAHHASADPTARHPS